MFSDWDAFGGGVDILQWRAAEGLADFRDDTGKVRRSPLGKAVGRLF